MSTTMTIRLDEDVKLRLDRLADSTHRSRSFLAAEAVRAYVESNEWQIAEIEAALSENTRVQVDISSVNGLGNVFHRRREAGWDWVDGETPPPGRTVVFVMDWRDHPVKNQEWYDQKRQKAESEGLLHIFAQEVDRDYSAAVEGTIIPAEWVVSAIDAHIKLDMPEMMEGQWVAALDVAVDLLTRLPRMGSVLTPNDV